MKIQTSLVILLIISCFFHCTENPFDQDDKISSNTISGKVALSDQLPPVNVYVWLKVLDISTRTDENGSFTIQVPSPSKQPGGGLNGLYDIYFYASNYVCQSVQITFVNGNVQYTDQLFDRNGKLKTPVTLFEMLSISASFRLGQASEASETRVDTVFATFAVKAKYEPVKVTGVFSVSDYPGDPEFSAGFLLDSEGDFIKTLKHEEKSHRTSDIQIATTSGFLKPVILFVRPGELLPGQYTIVPYLVIHQENLPSGLITSIGQEVTDFTPDYLNIPIIIRDNTFEL